MLKREPYRKGGGNGRKPTYGVTRDGRMPLVRASVRLENAGQF